MLQLGVAVHAHKAFAKLLLELDGAFRVVYRRLDLAPVPHDAGVFEEPLDAPGVEAGDAVKVEPDERLSKVLALPKNRQPTEPRLEAIFAVYRADGDQREFLDSCRRLLLTLFPSPLYTAPTPAASDSIVFFTSYLITTS